MSGTTFAATPPTGVANDANEAVLAHHIVRGRIVEANAVTGIRHRSRDLGADFITPPILLDDVTLEQREPPPLYDTKVAEIVEFLVALGDRLRLDDNVYLQEALERVVATNPLPRRVVTNLYRSVGEFLSGDMLMGMIEGSFGNAAALDGWVEKIDTRGNRGALRAVSPKMVHILAGNAPTGCATSIAQGALVKGFNLFKMPSSDLFTCAAMLRTMEDMAPDHPVTRSMSAMYWRGGDETIERTLYRPQYFDRIVAWGGGEAIDNVVKYLGPGIQLVSFDPKTSISLIGPEGFASDDVIDEVAERAAHDASIFNQEACLASRFIFAEGERAGVEKFCARLQERLHIDRPMASAEAPPPPENVREEIEMMQIMGEESFVVFGKANGHGLVILTPAPVSFHPVNKTVNVVHVESLWDAVPRVNCATQTIGIFPDEAKAELRDALAQAGAQRLVRLGGAMSYVMGGTHDGMLPLQRFVKWASDVTV